MGENCITCDVVLGSFGFWVCFTCLPGALLVERPSGRISWFLRFYWHSLFGRPFGDSIFLLVKKDRGERHAKGLQSRPLESCFYTGVRRGDVPASYEFARVQLTRFRPVRGVWQAHCFHGLDCTARNAVELLGFIE